MHRTERGTAVVRGRRLYRGWLAAVVLGLTGSLATAQQPAVVGPEQAAALLEQARPYLEGVTGYRFATPPRFRSVPAGEMRRLPDAELETQLHWQYPDLAGDAWARAVETAKEFGRQTRLARFQSGTDTILLPDSPTLLLNWMTTQIPSQMSPAVFESRLMQLALVHEAARMLLEQHYGLANWWSNCRDGEEFQAFQGALEGRAQWVTWQVAHRLGKEAETCFPLLAQGLLHGPESAPDAGLLVIAQDTLQRRHWAYARGLAFFDYLEQHGERDVEKRVFTRPPRQTACLERPELYLRVQAGNQPGLAETLAKLEQALPTAQWSAGQQPWTPDMVLQVAAMFHERPRAENILRSWEESRSLVWALRSNPSRQVALGVVRFQEASAARAYQGLAIDLQRKQDEMLSRPCEGAWRVLESRSSTVAVRGAEEAVRSDKRLKLASGVELPVSVLVARTGGMVVELTWHGLPADLAWAEQVLGSILPAPAAQR